MQQDLGLESVSIRPPSEDRGKPLVNHDTTLVLGFNPPPIRRQGETCVVARVLIHSVVSIRPPSEDRGKPPGGDLRQGLEEVSIRPPSEDRGKRADNVIAASRSSVSIRPPSEDRGKPISGAVSAPHLAVSIRPPSEDRGKHLYRRTLVLPSGFQSAPHPKTGGNALCRTI